MTNTVDPQQLRALEDAARACLQDATPQSAQALVFVLEHWNGLTNGQRARVYSLVEQLHRATAIRRAGPAGR